mmetsp:Transcript_5249/g.9292  ORF Transcript_5249/g.9292 Transcript_5249/m.9292 type:complete len:569 (-) Transcript_5249:35-1741(-)
MTDSDNVSIHSQVADWHSMIMGLLIVGNIAMFAGSMAILAAVDNMVIQYTDIGILTYAIPPGEITIPVYKFDLASTFTLMYNGGGVWAFIAIVLILASGCWPYIKLLNLAAVWYMPMGSKRREWTLWFTDISGKVGYVNFYLLFLIGVSLGISSTINLTHMSPAASTFLEGLLVAMGKSDIKPNLLLPNLTIKLALDAKVALFLYVVALMLSIAITQHAVSMHFWFTYGDDHSKLTGKSFKSKYKGNYLAFAIAAVLSLAAVGLFIWVLAVDMFTFTYGGMLGPMLVPEKTKTFSLISVGTGFPSQTYTPYDAGSMFLAVIYFYLCICGPIILGVAIACMWAATVFDLPARWRRRFLRTMQFAGAWSALDVFLVCFGIGTYDITRLLDYTLKVSMEGMVIPEILIDILKKINIPLPNNVYGLVKNICGPEYTMDLSMFSPILPLGDQSHCLSVDTQLLMGYYGLLACVLIVLIGGIATAIMLSPSMVEIEDGKKMLESEDEPHIEEPAYVQEEAAAAVEEPVQSQEGEVVAEEQSVEVINEKYEEPEETPAVPAEQEDVVDEEAKKVN